MTVQGENLQDNHHKTEPGELRFRPKTVSHSLISLSGSVTMVAKKFNLLYLFIKGYIFKKKRKILQLSLQFSETERRKGAGFL